ncbi:type II secretion system protein, partial [Planctomycetota bacterium]
KMRAKSGFTLVEILIVVVILGILAAVVIPQFTEASSEAKLSSLCTDLQTMRSQIELYKVQHNDNLPGVVNGISHPSGIGDISDAFTNGTDVFGDAGTDFGPYMQKVPTNQFVNSDVITTGQAAVVPTVDDGTAGWYFNTLTGELHAITSDHAGL